MQLKDRLFCNFNGVVSLSEELFTNQEIAFRTVSITNDECELMIFIDKNLYKNNYRVRVYKNKATDVYVPHVEDNVILYEENDECTVLYFETFISAKNFVSRLGYNHREYHVRPYRKISKKE